MSQGQNETIDDQVADGLMAYAELVQNVADAKTAGIVYAGVKDKMRVHIRGNVVLAFAGMVIRSDFRGEGSVVVTDDRLVVAWRKGTFRKETLVIDIARADITEVKVGAGTSAAVRQATVLTVTAGTTSVEVALPQRQPALGEFLVVNLAPQAG